MASSSIDGEGERDKFTCFKESADIHNISASCSPSSSLTVVYGPVNKGGLLTESSDNDDAHVHGLVSAGVGGNTKACETIEYHGWPDLVQRTDTANSLHDGGSNGAGNYCGIPLATIVPGVVGLTNLGNTCFINSGLQCIFNNRILVDYFLNQFTEREYLYSLPANSLCACFIRLLTKVWSKDRQDIVLRPVEFKEVLGKVHTQFQDYRQHDCQEFLALLLGTLHDQLNTASITNKKKLPNTSTPTSCLSSNIYTGSSSTVTPTATSTTTSTNITNSLSASIINKRNINCTNDCFDTKSESNDSSDASNLTSSSSTSLSTPRQKKIILNRNKLANIENSFHSSISGDEETSVLESNRQKRLKTCSKTFTNLNEKENNLKNMYIAQADPVISDDFGEKNPINDAKEEWKRYLADNKSIIVDTFQGQFKSTVKCSNCNHISVTFEPFMYLALPLPFALQRQVVVSFFSAPDSDLGIQYHCPVKFLITVNKYDKVSKVILELRKLLQEERKSSDLSTISSSKVSVERQPKERPIVLAEVCSNYISKILEDTTHLKYIDDTSTSFYAFELPEPPKSYLSYNQTNSSQSHSLNSSQETFQLSSAQANSQVTSTPASASTTTAVPVSVNNDNTEINDPDFSRDQTNSFNNFGDISPLETEFLNQYFFEQIMSVVTCAVCLDEKPRHQLFIHHSCDCHLCDQCLEMTIQHFSCGEKFMCPTCNKHITRSEFVPLVPNSSLSTDKFGLSIIIVPLYFRTSDQWNRDEYKLIQHPVLLRLPNLVPSMHLYSTVDRFVPFPCPYSLHWADMKGLSCSRCSWGSSCRGCEIARFGDINLQSDEALVVHFDPSFSSEHSFSSLTSSSTSSSSSSAVSTTINTGKCFINHRSMRDLRPVKNLTLDDCLRAFSSSETLDKDNPWFCPVCNCNQKARKCLTIWKSPATLMVYLKRFIYHGMSSVKVDDIVEFPIVSLNMSPFIHDPLVDNSQLYDLQAYVCHSGSVSSGHYTAFAKHCLEPHSNDWYYFNDDSVIKQEPSGLDERAYILFYTQSSSAKIGVDLSLSTSSWMFKESIANDSPAQKEVCVSNEESRELLLQVQVEPNESNLNVEKSKTFFLF